MELTTNVGLKAVKTFLILYLLYFDFDNCFVSPVIVALSQSMCTLLSLLITPSNFSAKSIVFVGTNANIFAAALTIHVPIQKLFRFQKGNSPIRFL